MPFNLYGYFNNLNPMVNGRKGQPGDPRKLNFFIKNFRQVATDSSIDFGIVKFGRALQNSASTLKARLKIENSPEFIPSPDAMTVKKILFSLNASGDVGTYVQKVVPRIQAAHLPQGRSQEALSFSTGVKDLLNGASHFIKLGVVLDDNIKNGASYLLEIAYRDANLAERHNSFTVAAAIGRLAQGGMILDEAAKNFFDQTLEGADAHIDEDDIPSFALKMSTLAEFFIVRERRALNNAGEFPDDAILDHIISNAYDFAKEVIIPRVKELAHSAFSEYDAKRIIDAVEIMDGFVPTRSEQSTATAKPAKEVRPA